MKLRDASKTEKVYPPPLGGPMAPQEKVCYQELEFDTDMLPEIPDWKVGENYKLVVEVKMKSHEIEEEDDGTQSEEAEFDVLSVAAYEAPADAAARVTKDKLGIA